VHGLTENVEIGLNYFYTRSGGDGISEFQPHMKWRFFSDEDRQIALSIGSMGYSPVSHDASDASAIIYLNASKAYRSIGDLRITGGAYRAVSSNSSFGIRGGIIVGIEKQITDRVSCAADWFSGRNLVGYSGAGMTVATFESQSLTLGYFFGNSERGNNGLSIGFGINF
jgi:hypothetical protein